LRTNRLEGYISDPKNAEYNFSLGLWYEDQGHTAGAAGFYIRTAEHSTDSLLSYEALLRLANCFLLQGCRTFMSKGILLRAISLLPERPEAYFLLSQLYEHVKDWQEAYTFAVMGNRLSGNHPKLRTNVGYPGKYGFTFEQAVSAWWIGLFDESLHLLRELRKDPTMLPVHIQAVNNNLKNLDGSVWHDPLTYYGSMYERLRVKFPGSQQISHNYSQAFQDMFVLTMLNGKTNGSFLEIGCSDPLFNSNTKLLEEWGWNGISIDNSEKDTANFAKSRKSRLIIADATRLDYEELLSGYRDLDYLQVDIEPALNTLSALLRIPFEHHRFAVVTFEHDDYCTPRPGVKERQRQYLKSHGYQLIVGDIGFDRYSYFEDWWVHPDLVDPWIIKKMLNSREGNKPADQYMLG